MTYEDVLAIFEADMARFARNGADGVRHPMWIDWHELFGRVNEMEWLVEDVWPAQRQIHIHAARKTGKSLLSLWIACCLACGRDPFTSAARRPVRVAYLDYEMTQDDLRERVEEMGFGPDDLHENLLYALHPPLPMLDTHEGGMALMERLSAEQAQAVVMDTFSRIVGGDENSNDTYRAFFRHTGMPLKAAGIAMLRLDHEGHTEGRSRGASAKADDVDVVWQLKRQDDGFTLDRKQSRLSVVPERVSIRQNDEPLSFTRANIIIPNGTMDKVADLDAIDAPIDVSIRDARKLLIAAGKAGGKNAVLASAIKVRTNRILGL